VTTEKTQTSYREENMVLEYVSLGVIFALLILLTVVIVQLGSLPGKIARRRGHPWPDAVNAASWIGLATGIFWPLAFIWAFLPLPARTSSSDVSGPGSETGTGDAAKLQDRFAALEATIEKLQKQDTEKEGSA
jgi:hypothetical protein